MLKRVYRREYIPVAKGDVVQLEKNFPPDADKCVFPALVINVEERYVLMDAGTRRLPPLIKVKNIFTGKIEHYDNLYVKSVIKKYCGPKALPRNVFRENITNNKRRMILTEKRGIISGPLPELARIILSKFPFELNFQLNIYELLNLYEKQKAGLIERYFTWGFRVHRRPFENWVRRNAYKICKTAGETLRENTKAQKKYEDEYWRDYLEEMSAEI